MATTTSVSLSPNPSSFGESVTFTAQVTPDPGAGSVQYTIDGVDFGVPVPVGPGGSAVSDATSDLPVGDHTVAATFSGTADFLGSTGTLTQTVVRAAPSTDLVADVNPSTYGDLVTFTATVGGAVGTPSGTVTFQSDGTTIPGCDLQPLTGGVATCATDDLGAGTHSVTADYSGDDRYAASSAAPLTQVIATSSHDHGSRRGRESVDVRRQRDLHCHRDRGGRRRDPDRIRAVLRRRSSRGSTRDRRGRERVARHVRTRRRGPHDHRGVRGKRELRDEHRRDDAVGRTRRDVDRRRRRRAPVGLRRRGDLHGDRVTASCGRNGAVHGRRHRSRIARCGRAGRSRGQRRGLDTRHRRSRSRRARSRAPRITKAATTRSRRPCTAPTRRRR